MRYQLTVVEENSFHRYEFHKKQQEHLTINTNQQLTSLSRL